MSEYHTITKTGDLTVIKTYAEAAGSTLKRMIATSKNHLIQADEQSGKIRFPNCDELNRLNLCAENLTTAQHTAFSTNPSSDTEEVFDAINSAALFQGK